LSNADILPTRKVLQMRAVRPHFLVQKTSVILKFMMNPYGQGERGLKQGGHLADKGRGSKFFAISADDGRPLRKIQNISFVWKICIAQTEFSEHFLE